MEPLSGTVAALTIFEKLRNLYRDWTGKLPEGDDKEKATKELASMEEDFLRAKIELAKGLGYPLCKRHFPPGLLLDISEKNNRRWKCDYCDHIAQPQAPQSTSSVRESWVRSGEHSWMR